MHTLDEEGGSGLLEGHEAAIKKSPAVNEANPVFIRQHRNRDQMSLAREVKLSMTCPATAEGSSQPAALHLLARFAHSSSAKPSFSAITS